MKEWDILDEIPYKYFKRYHKDDDIEVNIYHTDDDDDRPTYCTIVFEFELEYDCSKGSLPLYTTKKFKSKITYNTSSPFALFITTLQDDKDEEDSDEDSDE
tara:strand:- start:7595 stop:7897 length:303 start_codon:yes stop_codon:yes gene_type:complete